MLAIHGGDPIRPGGEASWPIRDFGVQEAFEQLMLTGAWGRYLGPHGDALRDVLAARHADGDDPAAIDVKLCGSGTAAVLFALVGVQVGRGDEVILSSYDFKANLGNLRSLGAVPVLVDCGDDAQMETAAIAAAITDRTRAILVSHLHGGSVRMGEVSRLAAEHGLAVIEDVCQNPLAYVDGRLAGRWGDVAALSFGGSKILSAGRGGATVTADGAIAARIRRYANRGNEVSPLSEMQAAILLPQIAQLGDRAAIRRQAAAWLGDRLAPLGLMPIDRREGDGCLPDYYKVAFWYDRSRFGGVRRDRFCEALHAEGITVSPGFPALHRTHSRQTFRTSGDLATAERAGESLVTLHHPILLDGEPGWQQVVDAVAKVRDNSDSLAT